MSVRPEVFCRRSCCSGSRRSHAGRGFFLMRYVAITPRVEAWLRSIPIALIGAILGPIAVNGGPPEWLGVAAAIGLMHFSANEFAATIRACATVALARAAMA